MTIIAAGTAVLWFMNFYEPHRPRASIDALARCLSVKGAMMYGASWCPHCRDQKREFGDSFRFISYVECAKATKDCETKKIDEYPTWILEGEKRLTGKQSLKNLSVESGCRLP